MLEKQQDSLHAEKLMTHLRALASDIGARPPTSRQERLAADYVRRVLRDLGIEDVREQFFTSQESAGWTVIPYLAVAAVVSLLGGRLGKLLGGITMLAALKGLIDTAKARTPFYQPLIAQGVSQNVVARVPASGEVKRRVYLIAHLDTNKQRFLAPQPIRELTKPLNTLGMALGLVGGVSMVVDALRGKREPGRWQKLAGVFSMLSLVGWMYDETQPHVEGANDNASAVAVLLGIAEKLKAEPLPHTEVTLLFTGCEEVICVGIEEYIKQYAPPKHNSYFIDLEMVGTGRLCYVTKHGMTHFSEYRPGGRIMPLAAKVARERTELRVTGKDMLMVDEVANLRERGYDAICIAGYDDQGFLANWHRVSDQLNKIEPDTLTRAAHYTYALMREIDEQAS